MGEGRGTNFHLINPSLRIILPALLPLFRAGHIPNRLLNVSLCVLGVAAEHAGLLAVRLFGCHSNGSKRCRFWYDCSGDFKHRVI